jgi:hypothetical protein
MQHSGELAREEMVLEMQEAVKIEKEVGVNVLQVAEAEARQWRAQPAAASRAKTRPTVHRS